MARTQLYPPSVDPGFPELGQTPEGWTRTTFGDILTVIERPEKLEPDRSYQLVTAKRNRGGIVSRGFLLGSEVLTKTQFLIKAGDFLISRRQIIHGACGVVPVELDQAVVSNEYSTLRTRPQLLMEFLRQYSHTPYFQRTCFHSSHGVDVEKMIFKLDQWLKCPVDLPSIGEQSKIVSILADVENAIAATQAVIDQLAVVKKSLMAELLTRGIPGRHTKFKVTEIGEVPEGWGVQRIDSLGTLGSGTTPSRLIEAYFTKEGGTPWVKTLDLNDGIIRGTDEQVTELALAQTSLRLFPAGTVLIAMYGGFAQIGRTGVLGMPAATNQAICSVQLGSDMTPSFLNIALVALRHRWMVLAASSRKDPNITKQDIAGFLVPVPSRDEQNTISDALIALETRLHLEREAIARLRSVRAGLMSSLLTGELRVPPDKDPA